MPSPSNPRLNKPSPPATAEDKLLLATVFCFNSELHAKNNPSSRTID